LPVLRQRVQPACPDPRPRGADLAWRPRRLGKRGDRLLPLQFPQGRAHPAAGRHAPAGRALPAQLGRAPDPLEPAHPGRPDGLPEEPPAPPGPPVELRDLTPAGRSPTLPAFTPARPA